MISLLMIVRNNGRHIAQALRNLLQQSCTDWELLIADRGSTDDTIEKIEENRDPRIKLLPSVGKQTAAEAWNACLTKAQGRYVALARSEDIMYAERLAIQRNVLETRPEITVCSAWADFADPQTGTVTAPKYGGIVKQPVLAAVQGEWLAPGSLMIRHDFLNKHGIVFQPYAYAEIYKLTLDIAVHGGIFYMDPQALQYCGPYEPIRHSATYNKTVAKIRDEAIRHCSSRLTEGRKEIETIHREINELRKKRLLTDAVSTQIMYALLNRTSLQN